MVIILLSITIDHASFLYAFCQLDLLPSSQARAGWWKQYIFCSCKSILLQLRTEACVAFHFSHNAIYFNIGTSTRGSGYTSRWKLVLSDYNSIQLRVFNSQALLEGTNLVLFNINEGALVRIYTLFLSPLVAKIMR